MHYYGICICEDERGLWDMLRQYDENDEDFFVEEIGEEACAESYRTDTARFHVGPNGDKYIIWESPYLMRTRLVDGGLETYGAELPPDWSLEVLPVSERYSFAEYLEKYKGYEFDAERNVHVSRYNPNGKYDYVRIGGRWPGKLAATDGERAEECWEVAQHRKRHPDYDPYGDDGYDIAYVDDLKPFTEDTLPYFLVDADGWHEKEEWEDDAAKFWREFIAPYLGRGMSAYVIDIHS